MRAVVNLPQMLGGHRGVLLRRRQARMAKQFLYMSKRRAPLQRNVTGNDVGETAVYLLSDLSSGVTGQTLFVDCGFSAVAL